MESCYLRPKLSLGKFRLGLNQACLQKFILKLFESTYFMFYEAFENLDGYQ